jgi:hypothetical protein
MSKRTSRERLDHFVRTVHRIETDHELTSVRTSLNIKFDASGLSSSLDEPEFHRLRSLLIAIRPFLLAKDDVCLARVFADARGHVTDLAALTAVESAATAYGQLNVGGGFQIVIDGARVTPEEAAGLFLYGGDLIHSDKDKEDRLASLDSVSRNLLRNEYLWYMFQVLEIAVWTASVIAHERERDRLTT